MRAPGPMKDSVVKICVKGCWPGNGAPTDPWKHEMCHVGWFPHRYAAGPHPRVGLELRCASRCATRASDCRAANGELELERCFITAVGSYSDLQGKKYAYTRSNGRSDLPHGCACAPSVTTLLAAGSRELPGIFLRTTQHFVVQFHLRAFVISRSERQSSIAQLKFASSALIWPISKRAPDLAAGTEEKRCTKPQPLSGG